MSGARIYPWDRWTNGQYWRIQQNVDFTCYGVSMPPQLYFQATARGLAVATSVFEYDYEDDVVFFHFFEADSLWMPRLKSLPAVKRERERHRSRVIRPQ